MDEVSEPTDQPSNQPASHPANEPSNQPTGGLTDGPTDRPTDRPTNRPTGGLTDRPTDRPVSSSSKHCFTAGDAEPKKLLPKKPPSIHRSILSIGFGDFSTGPKLLRPENSLVVWEASGSRGSPPSTQRYLNLKGRLLSHTSFPDSSDSPDSCCRSLACCG